MQNDIEEKAKIIIKDIENEKGNDPCKMFRNIVKNEYINIHGPEHHILDGACLLMTFYNAGGKIDIDAALEKFFLKDFVCLEPCADFGEYVVQFLPAV